MANMEDCWFSSKFVWIVESVVVACWSVYLNACTFQQKRAQIGRVEVLDFAGTCTNRINWWFPTFPRKKTVWFARLDAQSFNQNLTPQPVNGSQHWKRGFFGLRARYPGSSLTWSVFHNACFCSSEVLNLWWFRKDKLFLGRPMWIDSLSTKR